MATWFQIEEQLAEHATELAGASALLRLAADVLHFDSDGHASWVVQRAVNTAMNTIRLVLDDGANINATDAAIAAVELWLGLTAVKATIAAGSLAGQIDDPAVGESVVFLQLRQAADRLDSVVSEALIL